MKISACMIVKNEEENLRVSLPNLCRIADEIIVADTGSIDGSRAVAKAHGAAVYEFRWADDFAAAKNFALGRASGDWIVFLDADEYFASDSISKVRRYAGRFLQKRNIDAIGCTIVNIDTDRGNHEINSFPAVRIFKNTPRIRYVGAVHENLVKSGGELRVRYLTEEIRIFHTGYSSRIVKKKMARNLALLQKDAAENGLTVDACRYFCDCYHGLGDYRQAYAYGKRYMERQSAAAGTDTTICLKMLYSLLQFETNEEKIEREFAAVWRLFPDAPEFHMQYADYCRCILTDYEKALVYYEKAAAKAKRAPDGQIAQNFRGYEDVCYVRIGEIYQMMRRDSDAAVQYAQALAVNPYNAPALQRLCRLLKKLAPPAQRIAALNGLCSVDDAKNCSFLEKGLFAAGLDETYLYYAKRFAPQREQTDCRALYALFAARKANRAYEVCCRALAERQTGLFFLCMERRTCSRLLTAEYKSILEAAQAGEGKVLPAAAEASYRNVVGESIARGGAFLPELLKAARKSAWSLREKTLRLLMERGRASEALRLYESMDEGDLPDKAVGDKAVCLYKNGRYSEARACFARAAARTELSNAQKSYQIWADEKEAGEKR